MAILHKQYIPTKLTEMYGNESVLEAINILMSRDVKNIPHSFLLHGEAGCGKTSLAYIIATLLECKEPTLIDASDDRGIGSMRILKEMAQYAPRQGRTNVFIMDEIHGLLSASQEAILELLHNPPEHSYFILCTTEPQKLKITLKRRCHEFELKLLPDPILYKLLQKIISSEGIEDFPTKFIDRIVTISNGSPGVALKILDEVIDCENKIIENILDTKYAIESTVISICRALVDSKWKIIQKLIKDYNGDEEALRKAVMGYFGKVLLSDNGHHLEAANIMHYFSAQFDNKNELYLALYMSCMHRGE